MTRRAQKEPFFLPVVRLMLRAHGIVGAELSELECLPEVLVNAIRGLDQAAERAFGIRACRVEKDAVARLADVDTFANRTGSVPALERDGRD